MKSLSSASLLGLPERFGACNSILSHTLDGSCALDGLHSTVIFRDAAYMWTCDHIFCKILYTTYFAAYNSILKIAYAKICNICEHLFVLDLRTAAIL